MNRISGYEIYDYVTAGAQKIIHQQAYLNEINVFPVADGDTGSNLAYTMKCIIAGAKRTPHAGDALNAISDVALEDAYGNSGAIFASYLYGLSREAGAKESLNLAEFSEMAYRAVNYAYDALAKPAEGTILTVMKAWGNYLKSHHAKHSSLSTLMADAAVEVKGVLENTKHQLKVLADADVVDAGALGFVYFLEGIRDFLQSGIVSMAKAIQGKAVHIDHVESEHRFCTEFVFEPTSGFDKAKLFETLSLTDDAVIVQRIGNFVKVHTHTNAPELAHGVVRNHGAIVKSKVDDMHFQIGLQKSQKRKIGIVTDSIASISGPLLDCGYVYQIPLQLIIEGNTYTDQLTLSNADLFELLDKTKKPATSAQPGERAIEKNLSMMLDHFDHIIGIFVSAEMSGMYQKVIAASRQLDQTRMTIIDSKRNSAAQGLMVHTAYEGVEAGKSVSEIVDELKESAHRYPIYVEIPDLHYATVSGRVPKVVGLIAGAFKLKAIISIDDNGKGTITRERSLVKKAKALVGAGKPLKYGIVYTGDLVDFEPRIAELSEIFGSEPVIVAPASTIVSAFIGKGALGFSLLMAP